MHHRRRSWYRLQSSLALAALLMASWGSALELPAPAATDWSDHSRADVDCVVDVLGHGDLATAGEFGDRLRLIIETNGPYQTWMVAPVRGNVRVYSSRRCWILVFEYRAADDVADPPPDVLRAFTGIARRFFAGADYRTTMRPGVLMAWIEEAPAGPQDDDEMF